MTDVTGALEPETRKEVRWHIVQQLPLLVVLVVLWMMLWGALSWLNLVTGIVLALLVTRLFYLPSIELTGRLHPWWFLVLLARFAFDLVLASFQVAVLAFRGVRLNAVIAVPLVSRSDLITTLTAINISLIPGSIVVEVDRGRSILYLHVLDTPDQARADAMRQKVLATEERTIRALGSAEDLRRSAAHRRSPGVTA